MVVSWIEIITSEPLELLLDITKLVLLFNYYLFLYLYLFLLRMTHVLLKLLCS